MTRMTVMLAAPDGDTWERDCDLLSGVLQGLKAETDLSQEDVHEAIRQTEVLSPVADRIAEKARAIAMMKAGRTGEYMCERLGCQPRELLDLLWGVDG